MSDTTPNSSPNLETAQVFHDNLNDFLASVERRAYKQAFYAVRNEENALDIVQDAMMSLTQSYSENPPQEWPMLFTRILQNAIHNHFRRHKIRDYWTPNFSQFDTSLSDEESNSIDIIEAIMSKSDIKSTYSTEDTILRQRILSTIEDLIKNLPGRQREAFILRYWEDYSVTETAQIMGCSEGSVKTHCSRATHALSIALQAIGITGSAL